MKKLTLPSLLAIAGVSFAGITLTTQTAASTPRDNSDISADINVAPPVVVAELFTSQSCSSCPPAEALFSYLAEQDNLLTLEWHVDYWDKLVHGGSKWKDPYSDKAFTERQRAYNQSLRGTRGVYTPQAIVNGVQEAAGNRRGPVIGLVEDAAAPALSVEILDNTVRIRGSETSADVLFVRMLKQHETDVKGGENKGRKLYGKNIVLEAKILGTTQSAPTQYDLPSVRPNETCAVLVQSLKDDVGPILGAAKCRL